MIYYTGIGSRETPIKTMKFMSSLGTVLGSKGLVLRSGGANGADTAFERGATGALAQKEIYLPWKNFNGHLEGITNILPLAYKIAEKIHPNWAACSYGARKLHARNIHQILGKDLNEPSAFVVCWTKNGEPVGGTRTAIVFAEFLDIPVFNLGSMSETEVIDAISAKEW